MAGTTKRDIELTVRGRNLSQQPMQEVATSINGVTKALNEQLAAANRGEAGAEELTSSLRQLREAGDALIRQQGLIDRFKLLGDSLETAKTKAAASAEAMEKLRAEMAQVEEPTKRQQQALDRAAASQDKANNAVNKAQAALDKQAAALKEVGIEAGNVDAASQQILTLATESAGAYNSLTTAVNGLGRAERQRRADAAAAAADDRTRKQSAEEAAALEREAKAQELANQKANESIEQTRRRADTTAVFTSLLDKLEKEELDIANSKALQEKLDRELATFRALADQLDITSRGYKTMGDAAAQAALGKSPTTNAGAAVQNVVNPAGVARSTVSGSSDEAAALAATAEAAAKARKPVQDFSDTMTALKAVLKSVADQAGTLDAFSRQAVQAEAAGAAYEALTAEVLRLEQAVRESTAPNTELAARLNAARQAASSAQRTFESETATLNTMGAAARKAGIDTENLSADEAKLAATARTAQGAMDSLSATHDKYGDALKSSTANSGFFQVGERQSLSLIQRIRGEILSLTAAYVGLQAVLGLAGGAIDAYVDKQAAENRLAVAVGNDQKAIAEEYDYVHGQAERLGIGIKELADEYSRFSIAGKNGNLSLEQRRYAFERITEVMRVNHSSTEDIGRAWVQLEQILSKGKVQMDDLRAAANSLPGIETALAKGLQNLDPTKFKGLSDGIDKIIASKDKAQAIPILFKAMKDGSVDAKVAILALAQEYEKEYGARLPDALKSLQAEQGRFSTQLYDFKLLIAQSGFADAYTQLLQKLSVFFKSDDGKKFAEDIGEGFGTLTKVLSFLIDNLDAVEDVLKLIVEIKLLTWTAGVISNFGTMAEKVVTLSEKLAASNISWTSFTNAATAGQKALLLVQGALGVVSAAVVGWEIGTLISDKFAIVRVVTQNFFAYLDTFGTAFWSGLQSLLIRFVGAITDTFSEALIKFKTFANEIGNAQASLYRAIGADGVADKLTNLFGDPAKLQADLDKRKALRQKELDDISKKSSDAIKLALDSRTTLEQQEKLQSGAGKAKDATAGTTSEPSEGGTLNQSEDDKKQKAAEARAKKIETLENNLAESLRQIDAKTEKQQKDSLEARLKAVDDTYQKIYTNLDKLQKLGGTKVTVKSETGDDVTYSIAQYKAQLESQKEVLKAQETEKFNKESLKTQETDLNNLLEERKLKLKDINDLLSSGAITAAEAFERSTKVFDDLNPKIKTAADNAKAFANAAVGKGVTASQASSFSAKTTTATDDNTNERVQALDVLKAGEAQINALITQRKDIIDANNNLVQVGLETEKDAQENIQQQNAILGPQITDQVTRLEAVLAKMHEDGALTDQDLALWGPKLQAAGAQAEVLSASLVRAKDLVSNQLVQGADNLLTSVSSGIAGAIKGTNSWNDALKGVADTALSFLSDFLIAIAKAIIKQTILNAVQAAGKNSGGDSGGGGGYGAIVSALASVLHTGGNVGSGNGMTRSAPAALWNNAPRYHQGTVVGGAPGGGLKSDERRAILQVGEEVLTRNDPRNALNGGKTASNGNSSEIGQAGGDIAMHVHADAASFLSAGLNQRAGQKSFFAFLSANRAYISKMLQSG